MTNNNMKQGGEQGKLEEFYRLREEANTFFDSYWENNEERHIESLENAAPNTEFHPSELQYIVNMFESKRQLQTEIDIAERLNFIDRPEHIDKLPRVLAAESKTLDAFLKDLIDKRDKQLFHDTADKIYKEIMQYERDSLEKIFTREAEYDRG